MIAIGGSSYVVVSPPLATHYYVHYVRHFSFWSTI